MYKIDGLDISLVDEAMLRRRAGPDFSLGDSVVVDIACTPAFTTRYTALATPQGLGERNRITIWYVESLLRAFGDPHYLEECGVSEGALVFQGTDCPHDLPSVAWQTKRDYCQVCLVPDFYYVRDHQFERERGAIDPYLEWPERRGMFFWRGGTTGSSDLTADSILALPRYRLCEIGARFGAQADFGFFHVVQTRSPEDAAAVEALLQSRNWLRPFLPLELFPQFKFIVQIDGNGNSWQLLRKLRLGCCMVMVDSDWRLWHHHALRAWEHYVPVAQNLSNLAERMDWCLRHDEEARKIAQRGRRLALSVDFESEMQFAAKLVLDQAMGG